MDSTSIYECPRCHKKFKKKFNFDRHLRRVVPCELVTTPGELVHYQSQNFENPNNYGVSRDARSTWSSSPSIYSEHGSSDFEPERDDGVYTKKIIINTKNNGYKQKFVPQKSQKIQKFSCHYCDQIFTRKYNCDRHMKSRCLKAPKESELVSTKSVGIDRTEFEKLKNEVKLLKSQPKVNQNILQVLCVRSGDNYLDMLTDEWGDFNQALKFIKDCALSEVNGDCKLLSKIYFENDPGNAPIRYLDRNRNKISYVNEEKKNVIDLKGKQLGRILANNLQNSYLKGINYLVKRNLKERRCPNRFLEDYDMQSWNKHIYMLSEEGYQKKVIKTLDIRGI